MIETHSSEVTTEDFNNDGWINIIVTRFDQRDIQPLKKGGGTLKRQSDRFVRKNTSDDMKTAATERYYTARTSLTKVVSGSGKTAMGASDSRRAERASTPASGYCTLFYSKKALNAMLVGLDDFDRKADNTADSASTRTASVNDAYQRFKEEYWGVLRNTSE